MQVWGYVIEGLCGGLGGMLFMILWLRWTAAGRKEQALMRLNACAKAAAHWEAQRRRSEEEDGR